MKVNLPIVIKGCQQNDILCQQQLYRFCYPDMIKVCSRYAKDQDTAGSIFNNAMLKVFKNISSYRDEGKLMGWVRTIVVNCCIDHCRQKTIFSQLLPVNFDEKVMIEPGVFDVVSGKEIRQFIAQLPAASAVVFNMYVYEGFTHKQIAEILGISDGTSKWHLSEAKKTLKKKLGLLHSNKLTTDATR